MADLTGWNIHGTAYDLADTTARASITNLGNALNTQRAMIAEEYDSTSTYAVDDYCIYNGALYICSTAIDTAEAWTAAHWTQTTVMDEFA